MKNIVMLIALVLLVFMPSNTPAFYTGDEGLGPQSDQAKGELRVLAVAVRFPDTSPSFDPNNIRKRVVDNLDQYVREQSYGQAWLKADFRGWVDLPDPLSKYKVSPYNFKVDRTRVRKLIEDTLTGLGSDVDFSRYKHILVIPGVHTTPGEGYGMLCYCANPGMLTGVKGKLAFATVRSRNGKEFGGGIFVGAENAHLGMFAHDFFHALGGIEGGKRRVP
jgi:M6 family metalloprotease-like protein